MSLFEERERAFEQAFIRQQETQFRAVALRNRLLGEWAAQRIGLKGRDGDAYVDEIVASATFAAVDEPLMAKIGSDFDARGIVCDEALIRAKMAEFLSQATQRLQAGG